MENYGMIFYDVSNLAVIPFKGQSLVKELSNVQGFLFQQALPDHEATVKYLAKNIPVYNDERPHYFLNGQTPEEAFRGTGMKKEEYKKDFQEAYTRRIEENKKARCRNCDDGGKFELAMA